MPYGKDKNLAAEKYPGIKTFRTLEDMLKDESIELVVVNTPITPITTMPKRPCRRASMWWWKTVYSHCGEANELIALSAKREEDIGVPEPALRRDYNR